MDFNHLTVHVCDFRKFFFTVGAAMGGGKMKIQIGLCIETPCTLGAVLGKDDNKKRRRVIGVDVLHMACQVGLVG